MYLLYVFYITIDDSDVQRRWMEEIKKKKEKEGGTK